MAKLCAPARDEKIAEIKEIKEITPKFRFVEMKIIFEIFVYNVWDSVVILKDDFESYGKQYFSCELLAIYQHIYE